MALNTGHELVDWIIRLEAASRRGDGVNSAQFTTALNMLADPLRYSGHGYDRFLNYVRT